jgi:membrane-bound metal-dependent hydrolase YbcI (DUF457 family)
MPSPLGHALGGLTAGWLIAGAPVRATRDRRPMLPWTSTWSGALVFAAIGMAPDLDFLAGMHRTYAHSLGAALIVTLAAMALTRPSTTDTTYATHAPHTTHPICTSRLTIGLVCGAAYASHILLDWLGTDGSPPIGVMALWPISSDYYESSLHLFMSTSRRYWLPGFWRENATAAAYEIGMLLPIAVAVYWLRRRRDA